MEQRFIALAGALVVAVAVAAFVGAYLPGWSRAPEVTALNEATCEALASAISESSAHCGTLGDRVTKCRQDAGTDAPVQCSAQADLHGRCLVRLADLVKDYAANCS